MIISTKDQYVALEAKGPRGDHHSRVIPFEAILNARAGTFMMQVRGVRIPTTWKLFEPVTCEPSEIPDDNIPF